MAASLYRGRGGIASRIITGPSSAIGLHNEFQSKSLRVTLHNRRVLGASHEALDQHRGRLAKAYLGLKPS